MTLEIDCGPFSVKNVTMSDSTTRNFSIVEYYGEQRKNKCGYCKNSDSCNSHGMQAHCLTNQDYQDLIDRGWRRSGTYCYKPKNDETCCPCYTIKCDVSTFSLSKSQKKIIKKLNKFLVDGQIDKADMTVTSQNHVEHHMPMDCCNSYVEPANQQKNDFDMDKAKQIVMQTIKEKDQSSNNESISKHTVDVPGCSEPIPESQTDESSKPSTKDSSRKSCTTGPDANKPLRKKAKLLRMERKAQKMALTNKLPDDVPKKQPKNVQKSLDTLLNEVQGNSRHKLEVKLLTSDESNKCPEVLKLYRQYQVAVHNDPLAKLTKSSFERFLVNSPLKVKLLPVAGNQQQLCTEELSLYRSYQTVIHNDDEPSASEFEEFLISSPLEPEPSSTTPSITFGSYHQQYWLDGKLIAVGVIDILPTCVSSVYFFYNPDYSFLSLGTYGSLREIHLVQQLQQQNNAISSYYMGFYIHSCPKMRYKGKLTGSYLLCPETYTWHLLDENIIQRLDASKYQRLNNDVSIQDVNRFTVADLDGIMILCKARMLMTFPQFAEKYPRSAQRDVFLEYGQLVGKSVAARIVKLIF